MAVIEAVAVVVFVISVLVSVFVFVLVFVIVSVLVFEVVAVDAVEVVTVLVFVDVCVAVLVSPRMQDIECFKMFQVFSAPIYFFVTFNISTSPWNSSQQTGARGRRGRYRCCGCWLCNVDLSQVHFRREVLVELPQRCQGSIGEDKASITVPLRSLLAQS